MIAIELERRGDTGGSVRLHSERQGKRRIAFGVIEQCVEYQISLRPMTTVSGGGERIEELPTALEEGNDGVEVGFGRLDLALSRQSRRDRRNTLDRRLHCVPPTSR